MRFVSARWVVLAAIALSSCGSERSLSKGYVVQTGDFGVFSDNIHFSEAYKLVPTNGPYREFSNESLDSYRSSKCSLKMYYVELSGRFDAGRKELEPEKFAILRELPASEANKIARASRNTVVGAMEFC